MNWEIKQGDALSVLRSMPDESVQLCVTSPPYYGLRSYGTNPVVWDGDEFCDHEWGAVMPFAKQDNRSIEQKIAQGATVGSNQKFNDENTAGNSGNFCQRCGAWRGELGLEPDFKLYISHLLQIFVEVKRVLKKDGTCWVNLGDSYSGSNGAGYPITKWSGVYDGESLRNKSGRDDGVLRPKSLMNIPARFAIGMTDELQMIQRNEIIWHKPACMPSSAKDRFTVDFEPIFFFSKNERYKFNQQIEPNQDKFNGQRGTTTTRNKMQSAMRDRSDADQMRKYSENGRNKRTLWTVDERRDFIADVARELDCYGIDREIVGESLMNAFFTRPTTWQIPFEPSGDEHYASYPTKLVETPILAGTDEGDTVLDPFNGTATTGLVALRHRRNYIGIELQEKYIDISKRRLAEVQVNLF